MGFEKRKSCRKRTQFDALVVRPDRSVVGTCTIADISNSGARLKCDSAENFPNAFYLLISKNAKVHRRCDVVWREEDGLGVQFLRKQR